jgi:arsenite-transporting ATPase
MAPLPFAPTRVLFFTGKGGVGKTSLACATAVVLADTGRRVLLVSTDPASNLDEVLGVSLSSRPTAIPSVAGLFALNIDPDAAAHDYRERVVGPHRTLLPASAVERIEEQLSGACTEIAAVDQFTSLLADPKTTEGYDHVIINGIFIAIDTNDPLARALETRGRDALAALPSSDGVDEDVHESVR